MRDVTVGAVVLSISETGAAQCNDFVSGEVAVPTPDWQPPYPYRQEEVFLDLPHTEAADSHG